MPRHSTRRQFVQRTAALGAAVWVGGSVHSDDKAANSRVRYACVGVGGKGSSDSGDAAKFGDIVAICDIDDSTLDKAGDKPGFEKAARYNDFRKMLEEMGDSIDAVTVSTPDHTHAPASAMAMNMGKACFTQKPLTHTVWEARRLQEIAQEKGVATMMGNQGTANSGLREAAAILKGGHLGAITEVHVFTNRPVWPQGIGRPEEEEAPPWIHWDEWLGPAAERGFSELYHPFKWRGWWDFGTGALGDMACHTFNMPYMGVELKDPTSIQAWTTGHDGYGYPQKSKIKFEFPKNDWRGDVDVWWYDGGNLPDESLLHGYGFKGDKNPRGAIIVCEGAPSIPGPTTVRTSSSSTATARRSPSRRSTTKPRPVTSRNGTRRSSASASRRRRTSRTTPVVSPRRSCSATWPSGPPANRTFPARRSSGTRKASSPPTRPK